MLVARRQRHFLPNTGSFEKILRSSLQETISQIFFFFFKFLNKLIKPDKIKKIIIIKNSQKSSPQETILKSTLYFNISLKVAFLSI